MKRVFGFALLSAAIGMLVIILLPCTALLEFCLVIGCLTAGYCFVNVCIIERVCRTVLSYAWQQKKRLPYFKRYEVSFVPCHQSIYIYKIQCLLYSI